MQRNRDIGGRLVIKLVHTDRSKTAFEYEAIDDSAREREHVFIEQKTRLKIALARQGCSNASVVREVLLRVFAPGNFLLIYKEYISIQSEK